jgi:hypothetical protein
MYPPTCGHPRVPAIFVAALLIAHRFTCFACRADLFGKRFLNFVVLPLRVKEKYPAVVMQAVMLGSDYPKPPTTSRQPERC